jgi:hypothetical protein
MGTDTSSLCVQFVYFIQRTHENLTIIMSASATSYGVSGNKQLTE